MNIALKHIYTQENASHVQEVENLINLLSTFLGESRDTQKSTLEINKSTLEMHKNTLEV